MTKQEVRHQLQFSQVAKVLETSGLRIQPRKTKIVFVQVKASTSAKAAALISLHAVVRPPSPAVVSCGAETNICAATWLVAGFFSCQMNSPIWFTT